MRDIYCNEWKSSLTQRIQLIVTTSQNFTVPTLKNPGGFGDFFHVELKKKYTTGSSRLSKRQLGLNTYTDCEQVFATLSRGENGENKDSSEESDLEVEILATGKTECFRYGTKMVI